MSVQQRKGISFSAVQRIAVRSATIPENARCRSHIRESLKDWHVVAMRVNNRDCSARRPLHRIALESFLIARRQVIRP